MKRLLLVGGSALVFVGVGLILPVVVAQIESEPPTGLVRGLILAGSTLIACGVVALVLGIRRKHGDSMPSGVRVAVLANIVILAFFGIEFSDGLVRQGGRLLYWSSFLFVPALLLLYGTLSARRWSWWTYRAVAAVAALWFLVFVVMIPFADLRGAGGPVPWHGRVYMICVSLAFAGIFVAAFWSLGREDTRHYFRLVGPEAAKGEL